MLRRTTVPTLALLVGATLAACGGDAPGDASETEFCDAQGSLFSGLDLGGADALPSDEELAEAFRDWGAELESVGTPEDMPQEARAGFEDLVREVEDVDAEDFSEEGLQQQLDDLSDETGEQAEAFTAYVEETCSGLMGDLGDVDLPELPDLPSSTG
jgi:hypothetical protein